MKKKLIKLVAGTLFVSLLSNPSYAKKDSYTSIGFIGNNNTAHVTINDKSVITIKSNNSDAKERTKKIAQSLNKLLFEKKLRADKIVPAIQDNHYIVKVGKDVIFTVDKDIAKAEEIDEAKLTLKWVNDLRSSLGSKPINYLSYRPNRSVSVATPISKGTQFGYASWYGNGFNGRSTSSGEIFNMNKLTAAHRTIPLGTNILVTNLDTGRSVIVKVNDRGPFADTNHRILDLSKGAFQSISSINSGVARIRIDVINK